MANSGRWRRLVVPILFLAVPQISAAQAEQDGVTEESQLTSSGVIAESQAFELYDRFTSDPTIDMRDVSISESDVLALAAGDGLDPEDPAYCEKKRDLCLVATCGSLSRANVPPECWNYCTGHRMDQCEKGE